MPGTLYLVGVDIGNREDVTLRARRILGEVDVVAVEEMAPCDRILNQLKIVPKAVVLFNEHNHESQVPLILSWLQSGQSVALMSDTGMPVMADPGQDLVRLAAMQNIPIVPIPGVASMVAALTVAGFRMHHFYYMGFLPRQSEQRQQAFRALVDEQLTTLVMETPYRLSAIMDDLEAILPSRRMALAWNLTMQDEMILRGTPPEIKAQIVALGLKKGEFVLVIEGIEPKPKVSKKDRYGLLRSDD